MNDCTNAEIRDQLPALLHERLDVSARSVVLAHVDGCVDCRDELQLLRDVQEMLARRTPRIDVDAVVRALPKPSVAPRPPARVEVRRRAWSDWRVAAAVTLLIAGGGSVALFRATSPGLAPTADTGVAARPAVPVSAPSGDPASNPVVVSSANPASRGTLASEDHAAVDVGSDNRLGDLTEQQLQALLNDIHSLRAVPASEPEPVSIRVNAKIGASESA